MKAIRVDRHGGPEVLALADVPAPVPKPGEVLIRQTAAGVNFIDVYFRTGLYPHDLPLIDGQEGAGTVEALGEGVTGLKVGQRVAYCGTLGAYAELAAVPAVGCVPIADGVDDRLACAVLLQGMTAHYLATDTFPLKRGDVALVHAAAGGAGNLLVQMAKLRGATVIATAGSAEKVQIAKDAGADHVINYTSSDFAEETNKLVGEKGVDVVYDSVGKTTWERSMSVLRPRGMLVLFGNSSGPVPAIEPQKLASSGSLYVTRPTLVHYRRTREELLARTSELFSLIAGGKLHVRIGASYPLGDAARAHTDLEARTTTGKLLLIP